MLDPLRILLVAGGWSPEREISLRGAAMIAQTLGERGHSVTQYDLAQGFDQLLSLSQNHDVAFLNLHGAPGEDGLVQALLEQTGCPYQGSGPAGSFLALNKAASKSLLVRAGLPTPAWHFLPVPPERQATLPLAFPLFIKSNTGGSSLDLYRASNQEELRQALEQLFAKGHEVLVEEMIPGREVTCGVLDPGPHPKGSIQEAFALPPVLIVPKAEFFDYHDKYADDGADEICPAPLPEAIIRRVQEYALTAHRCLGLRGYSRTDFILTDQDELYLLEVNTLPGMTSASLIPREAAALGMGFGELLETLLGFALDR